MMHNLIVLAQAKPHVTPLTTKIVDASMLQVDDKAALESEINALCHYVQHTVASREVMKQRKQWDDERQAKINEIISRAMKEWDNEHYPRLLEATWGWHPFYAAFVSNPLSKNFRPSYPLHHSVVEGSRVHASLLQEAHVTRAYPVPWSVLIFRCFLQFHSEEPPPISHPHTGGTVHNVTEWLKLADEKDVQGASAWRRAKRYLRNEGFLLYAGARVADSQQGWFAAVEAAWMDLKDPTPEWWADLRAWCNSILFRALQDMAFHSKVEWLNAWVIRDRPKTHSPPLACYESWLQHREDLDIGYVLANPGNCTHFQIVSSSTSLNRALNHLHVCIPWQMSWYPRWSVTSTWVSSATLPTTL